MIVKKRKLTFLLVIPRFEDIFHSYYAGEIIKGVSLSASRVDADFLVHITNRHNHQHWFGGTLLDRNYIDGIIFADIENDISLPKRVIQARIPCLVLNNILHEPMNYVAVDNKRAAEEIVEYLVKFGHRKIATIAGDQTTQSGLMRLEGFKEALDKQGLLLPKNYVTFGDYLRTPARIAAQKLLKLKERPTAVFAASDVMALELIDVAKSMNMRVPEDLSVIGFDDNPLVLASPVGLTTVSQPLVEMGRVGAENLFQIIQGKAKLPVKIILSTKFVKRESVMKI